MITHKFQCYIYLYMFSFQNSKKIKFWGKNNNYKLPLSITRFTILTRHHHHLCCYQFITNTLTTTVGIITPITHLQTDNSVKINFNFHYLTSKNIINNLNKVLKGNHLHKKELKRKKIQMGEVILQNDDFATVKIIELHSTDITR